MFGDVVLGTHRVPSGQSEQEAPSVPISHVQLTGDMKSSLPDATIFGFPGQDILFQLFGQYVPIGHALHVLDKASK
jgi:hypothetical protein